MRKGLNNQIYKFIKEYVKVFNSITEIKNNSVALRYLQNWFYDNKIINWLFVQKAIDKYSHYKDMQEIKCAMRHQTSRRNIKRKITEVDRSNSYFRDATDLKVTK